MVDAPVTAPVQDQRSVPAHRGGQHGIDALGRAAGEEQRVPGAAGPGKQGLGVGDGALAGVEVAGGRELRKIDGRGIPKQAVHPALVPRHMQPQRIGICEALQRIIEWCGHNALRNGHSEIMIP